MDLSISKISDDLDYICQFIDPQIFKMNFPEYRDWTFRRAIADIIQKNLNKGPRKKYSSFKETPYYAMSRILSENPNNWHEFTTVMKRLYPGKFIPRKLVTIGRLPWKINFEIPKAKEKQSVKVKENIQELKEEINQLKKQISELKYMIENHSHALQLIPTFNNDKTGG